MVVESLVSDMVESMVQFFIDVPIPVGAIRDRDGNFILDRDGNFILMRT